jgi:hypothetical protein|tara:strand:+ start:6148 stop:6318 length:171 start_codon:yes stop_codon:yes gene_type:complete
MTSKPKDLGLKVVPKEQVIWENVKKEAKVLIEDSENNLIIQKAMLKMAEEKITTFK